MSTFLTPNSHGYIFSFTEFAIGYSEEYVDASPRENAVNNTPVCPQKTTSN
jgi:hypothetical protein